MVISTVVAVALGVAPVQGTSSGEYVAGDYSADVGRYSQFVDRRGTTYVKGFDRRGVRYDLVMDKRGYVEANIGERVVSFRVKEIA